MHKAGTMELIDLMLYCLMAGCLHRPADGKEEKLISGDGQSYYFIYGLIIVSKRPKLKHLFFRV